MVINYGTDVYNQWVNHEIPFNDPKVLDVLDQMEDLILADGHINGGRAAARNTFGTAGNLMFDNPPGCYMYRQGNFVAKPGCFPDAVLSTSTTRWGSSQCPARRSIQARAGWR